MPLSLGVMIGDFVLLTSKAKRLVSHSSDLARMYRVPDLMIGLTIVCFGTSAPESVVNLAASLQGPSDTVYGNVVGSNIFNLFFILGVEG